MYCAASCTIKQQENFLPTTQQYFQTHSAPPSFAIQNFTTRQFARNTAKRSQHQACAKLLGFEPLIGYAIEKRPKYRYRIGIGYEIARECISILILFRNSELIDIGFDIDFEFLHVGILHQFRANILEGLCSKILVSKSILIRNIGQN